MSGIDDLNSICDSCALAANDDLFSEYKRLGYKELLSPSGHKRWTKEEYLGEVRKRRAMRVFVPEDIDNADDRAYIVLGYESVIKNISPTH